MPTTDALVEQAQAMLPVVQRELDRARRSLAEVRAEAHAAESTVERLRALERSLTHAIDGTVPDGEPDGLVGWRVGEAACAVIREAGCPLHYREVWKLMSDRGDVIASADPEAVVLTALTRHPDVVRSGRGIYAIEVAPDIS